jgi:hypothetical protein
MLSFEVVVVVGLELPKSFEEKQKQTRCAEGEEVGTVRSTKGTSRCAMAGDKCHYSRYLD